MTTAARAALRPTALVLAGAAGLVFAMAAPRQAVQSYSNQTSGSIDGTAGSPVPTTSGLFGGPR